jgi:hypothetical protein
MKSEQIIHDFTTDLKWSELPVQYVAYMYAIAHWWPEAEDWDRITNLVQQKEGKDVVISIPAKGEIKIQFKSRREYYDDLCVEYEHIFHDGRIDPGWINKPCDIDYLLYCQPPVPKKSIPKQIYKIDYQSLIEAWKKHETAWRLLFSPADWQGNPRPAKNADYDTYSAMVPWKRLEEAGVKIELLKLEDRVIETKKTQQLPLF